MFPLKKIFIIEPSLFIKLILLFVLTACGSSTSPESRSSIQNPTSEVEDEVVPLVSTMISTTTLSANTINDETALELIFTALGDEAAETPGRYPDDHYGVEHIYLEADNVVGKHFVFTSHLMLDGDRGEFIDRQRNEIKVFDSSKDTLKGFNGKSFQYTWKFKISEGMEFSRYASHLFQLKMKNGIDSSPVATLTVSEVSGVDHLQLRYTPDELSSQVLASTPISEVSGKWLIVRCFATFLDEGALHLNLERMSDEVTLIDYQNDNIAMWREIESGKSGYVRPKWGIYRRIDDVSNLRDEEEIVRFTDFEISEMKLISPKI